MDRECLQERYAKGSSCFGCGPSNSRGLRVRSFASDQDSHLGAVGGEYRARAFADWIPAEHHEAFPGMLNGGIIGALLDCHSNWTAAYQLMRQAGGSHPPCTVTAEFHVKLLRPTPSAGPVRIESEVVGVSGSKVTVEARILVAEQETAKCSGVFVAVKPGHPAYHRW